MLVKNLWALVLLVLSMLALFFITYPLTVGVPASRENLALGLIAFMPCFIPLVAALILHISAGVHHGH